MYVADEDKGLYDLIKQFATKTLVYVKECYLGLINEF